MVAIYHHVLKQGEDYSVELDLRDGSNVIDTTGWTGASAIVSLDGAVPLMPDQTPISFQVTFPKTGTARLRLSPEQTAALTPRRYLTDAKFIDALGRPSYFLTGDVVVQQSYTP